MVTCTMQLAAAQRTNTEDGTIDNVAVSSISQTPIPTNGAHWWRHWVQFKSGNYQQTRMHDPLLDVYHVGHDKRAEEIGGTGLFGLGAAENWDFQGTVSRNQLVTINYAQRTFTSKNIPYAAANNEAIHGCVYIDNTFMDVVDFQPTFEIHDVQNVGGLGPTLNPGQPSYNTTLGVNAGTPSDGLVHVLYGTSTFLHVQGSANMVGMVRENPSGPPSYVVEVAKSAGGVGSTYARGTVQCNNDDADATGWVDVSNAAGLATFVTGTDSDGRTIYGGIDMVRLRTLEPVKWKELTPSTTQGNATRYAGSEYYGHAFDIFIQTRVKPNTATAPDGSQLSVHASRARSNTWDGTTDPPSAPCWSQITQGGYQTNPTGWCQLATDPTASGNTAWPDPFENSQGTYPKKSFVVHRDTITVDGPRLHVDKNNVDGLTDVVDNEEVKL